MPKWINKKTVTLVILLAAAAAGANLPPELVTPIVEALFAAFGG
jgi:hypothetical protein